jgi:hypothetical protein
VRNWNCTAHKLVWYRFWSGRLNIFLFSNGNYTWSTADHISIYAIILSQYTEIYWYIRIYWPQTALIYNIPVDGNIYIIASHFIWMTFRTKLLNINVPYLFIDWYLIWMWVWPDLKIERNRILILNSCLDNRVHKKLQTIMGAWFGFVGKCKYFLLKLIFFWISLKIEMVLK